MTHETPEGNKQPLMDGNINILNSRYPEAMLHLTVRGYYAVSDVENCEDPSFKHDMKKYKFGSACLFLIKNFDGADEGFVGIYFRTPKIMKPEDREKIMIKLPKLLGLMNMIED